MRQRSLNVLWKKARRAEMTKQEAEIAAQTLEQTDLALVSTKGNLAGATSIAVELEYSADDVVYLNMTEATDLRLVTADDGSVRKARESHGRFLEVVVALGEVV
jgi:predicted nucleic acid-binding protein